MNYVGSRDPFLLLVNLSDQITNERLERLERNLAEVRQSHERLLRGIEPNENRFGAEVGTELEHLRNLANEPKGSAYEQFRIAVLCALEDEPIEDGVLHPADAFIEATAREDALSCMLCLAQLFGENYASRPGLSASILRCIGRMDYKHAGCLGIFVAESALAHRDAEVREAGIRALEAWNGPKAMSILRDHTDPEGWLVEYVERVLANPALTDD